MQDVWLQGEQVPSWPQHSLDLLQKLTETELDEMMKEIRHDDQVEPARLEHIHVPDVAHVLFDHPACHCLDCRRREVDSAIRSESGSK